MIDMEDELHRKALEQIARLQANYEARAISAEAFKVGVETVWACLGGVVRSEAFHELMHEANTEIAALPPISHVELFARDSGGVVALQRSERIVRMCVFQSGAVKLERLESEDDAIARVGELERGLIAKSFLPVDAKDSAC